MNHGHPLILIMLTNATFAYSDIGVMVPTYQSKHEDSILVTYPSNPLVDHG